MNTWMNLVRTCVGAEVLLQKKDFEKLSPEQFLALSDEDREDICDIDVVPASLGKDDDFGSIRVHWKTPRYAV